MFDGIKKKFGFGAEEKSVATVEKDIQVREKVSSIVGLDEDYAYSSLASSLGKPNTYGLPQSPRGETFKGLAEKYGKSVWVYACVYMIANSIASVPIRLYKKSDSKNKPLEEVTNYKDTPFAVIMKPNPYGSTYDLIESMSTSLELTGNCYVEMVKDETDDSLLELYNLQSHKVRIVPGVNSPISGYIYDTNGSKNVAFLSDEIMQVKYYNPFSDFYGMSPLAAGEISAKSDVSSGEWNQKFFENGARVDCVLETDGNLHDGTINRLRNEWNRLYKGVKKAHQVAVLEGGLKFKQISLAPKDMDFINMKNWTREEICSIFGVPPAMIGITEKTNYGNMESQKKTFWESTLLPKMKKIEDAINRCIIQPKDPNYVAKFDLDTIEALKESREIRARLASMLVDRGIMTQNEAREIFFNLPKVTGWNGDIWHMPQNLIPVDKVGQEGGGRTPGGGGVPGQTIGRPKPGAGNIKPKPGKMYIANESGDLIEFNDETISFDETLGGIYGKVE